MSSKKIIVGFITLFWGVRGLLGHQPIDNSFFSVRSQGNNSAMELFGWERGMGSDITESKERGFSATPFYETSKQGYALGRYFLPNGLNSVKFASYTVNPIADVDPRNFNLPSDFQGKISLRPQQRTAGLRLDYYHDLERWFGDYFDGLYCSLNTSLVNVENDPHLVEEITAAGTGVVNQPNSASVAFQGITNSSDWSGKFNYGKIYGERSKSAIADLDFKIGFRVINKEFYRLGLNLNVIIPTSARPEAQFLWEPVAGNAGHMGFGAGLDGLYRIAECQESGRYLEVSSHNSIRYFFEETYLRTLNLKHKTWGRYIRMRQQDPNDSTKVLAGAVPGVNALTRDVKVTPGFQYDTTMSLHLHGEHCIVTLGYNGWFRSEEDLNLKNSFTHSGVYGLSSINGALTAEAAAVGVSSNTTIKSFTSGDGVFLTSDDVDLRGQAASQSHKLFASITYDKEAQVPLWATAGTSYEFGVRGTALSKWALWATLGVAF